MYTLLRNTTKQTHHFGWPIHPPFISKLYPIYQPLIRSLPVRDIQAKQEVLQGLSNLRISINQQNVTWVLNIEQWARDGNLYDIMMFFWESYGAVLSKSVFLQVFL